MKKTISTNLYLLLISLAFSCNTSLTVDEPIKKETLKEFYSLIEDGIALDFEEMELESAVKGFDGDARQIEIYYLFTKYGAPFTKVEAMENVINWYYFPEGGLCPSSVEKMKSNNQYSVTEKDSVVFKKFKPLIIEALYENINSGDASIEVTAASALVYFKRTDTLVKQKLELYAKGINSDRWNLQFTASKFIAGKNDNVAIDEIKRKAKRALTALKKE